MAFKAFEKTNAIVTAKIRDESGALINGGSLDVVLLTIFVKGERSQTLRVSDDVLADPFFTFDAQGGMVWLMQPFENQIVDDTIESGDNEVHSCYFRFGWAAEDVGEIEDPFSTVDDSREVTVHHPGHGLVERDNVMFHAEGQSIGGLDMDSCWVVKEVVDADHYTIETQAAATATASDVGGTVRYWSKGKSSSGTIDVTVIRNDPI